MFDTAYLLNLNLVNPCHTVMQMILFYKLIGTHARLAFWFHFPLFRPACKKILITCCGNFPRTWSMVVSVSFSLSTMPRTCCMSLPSARPTDARTCCGVVCVCLYACIVSCVCVCVCCSNLAATPWRVYECAHVHITWIRLKTTATWAWSVWNINHFYFKVNGHPSSFLVRNA